MDGEQTNTDREREERKAARARHEEERKAARARHEEERLIEHARHEEERKHSQERHKREKAEREKRENADRERLYVALAAGNGGGPDEIAAVREAYAALLRKGARVGEWIQLPDGKWLKKKDED